MSKLNLDVKNNFEYFQELSYEKKNLALLDVVKEGQLKKGKIGSRNYHYYK